MQDPKWHQSCCHRNTHQADSDRRISNFCDSLVTALGKKFVLADSRKSWSWPSFTS
jgi:hypothetical protein